MSGMRKYGLDICRILACMLVVMIHTVMLFWEFDPSSATWAVYNLIAVFIRCGVPLFFMLSGALLLSRESIDIKKHVRRIVYFLLLYFVWSFICAYTDNSLLQVWYQKSPAVELLFGSYYHLWYLPAMIWCYLFIPVLHGFVHRDFRHGNYALWVFALLAVWVVLPLVLPESRAFSLLAEHFDPAYLRYLVYTLLGFWLYNHRPGGKKLALLGVLAFAAVLLFAWLNRRYSISIGEPSTRYYNYLSPAMLLLSAFVFSLCQHIEAVPKKLEGPIKELSACTLGIYLTHPLFISGLKSLNLDFTQFNTFIFFPACYLAFLLLPLITAFILRRIPIINKLL